MKENQKISRLDILNKRDKYFEYITNQIENFKDFLSTKTSKRWDLNSSILEDMYQKFLNLSKPTLAKVKELKISCIAKRSDIIKDIKLYSEFISQDSDDKIKAKFAALTANYERELVQLKEYLQILLNEKQAITKRKLTFDAITKQKIEAIREKIANNQELNVDIEHENVRSIIAEHKKFVHEEIEVKLLEINDKLKELNQKIRDKETEHIEQTYKYLDYERKDNKDEFVLLVEIEKDVILKTLKFQDYLEDLENFYNDQITFFNILFKSKKIIKLNKSRLIFKDVNDVMVDIISNEGLFDEVNKQSMQAEYLIDNKKGQKLKEIQSNLVGASSTSNSALLGMVKVKNDLGANSDNQEGVK